jgi:hypothetical protein
MGRLQGAHCRRRSRGRRPRSFDVEASLQLLSSFSISLSSRKAVRERARPRSLCRRGEGFVSQRCKGNHHVRNRSLLA